METLESLRMHYQNALHLLRSETKAREVAEKKEQDLEAQLHSAQAKMKELEAESKMKEPLYEIGREIRLRFMEQAREHITFTNPKNLDMTTIERGNQAAHSGNGIADAALLYHISTNPNINKLNEVYKSLYMSKPVEYMQTSAIIPKIREAIDLQATIRTVKSMNNGVDRPLKEKQSAMDAFEIIISKFKKATTEGRALSEGEQQELDRRLDALREFTKAIVEFDRRITGKDGPKKKVSETAY